MFNITASRAKKMSDDARSPFTTEEIVARIEKVISDATEDGQKSAEYVVTYRDFLLQGNPKRFVTGLRDKGFSVQVRRNDNPREGNNEVILLCISWND